MGTLRKAWEISVFKVPNKGPFVSTDRRTDGRTDGGDNNIPFALFLKKRGENYMSRYCKSGNFRENFIFANRVKRHICDVKNSRLWHGLHISVKFRVIAPFREDYIFTKFRIYKVSRK